MMDVNIWAVLVATVSSFLLGGLWYSLLLSLKPWQAAMGRTEEDNGYPAKAFGLSFSFAVVAAHVFALLLGSEPALSESWRAVLLDGFGFVDMSYGIDYQFPNRPFSVLFFDGGYHTVQLLLYGLILGAWH